MNVLGIVIVIVVFGLLIYMGGLAAYVAWDCFSSTRGKLTTRMQWRQRAFGWHMVALVGVSGLFLSAGLVYLTASLSVWIWTLAGSCGLFAIGSTAGTDADRKAYRCDE